MAIEDNTGTPKHATKPKKCPECGYLNPHTRTNCRKCGAELKEVASTMRCPDCGEEVTLADTKCRHCGLSIEEVKKRSQFVMTAGYVSDVEAATVGDGEAESSIARAKAAVPAPPGASVPTPPM